MAVWDQREVLSTDCSEINFNLNLKTPGFVSLLFSFTLAISKVLYKGETYASYPYVWIALRRPLCHELWAIRDYYIYFFLKPVSG